MKTQEVVDAGVCHVISHSMRHLLCFQHEPFLLLNLARTWDAGKHGARQAPLPPGAIAWPSGASRLRGLVLRMHAGLLSVARLLGLALSLAPTQSG